MERLNLTPQGSINELHLYLDNVFAQIVYGDIPNITFHHCSSDDFEISYSPAAVRTMVVFNGF